MSHGALHMGNGKMITKIFDIVAHAILVGLILTLFVLYFICINVSLFVLNAFQSIYQK
jgi:uncharacterized integral membrane protein